MVGSDGKGRMVTEEMASAPFDGAYAWAAQLHLVAYPKRKGCDVCACEEYGESQITCHSISVCI